MIIVIQCAAAKTSHASFKTATGKAVQFVARPEISPCQPAARPDDPSDEVGKSWRDKLAHYNKGGENPLGLMPAWALYKHRRYGELKQKYGEENLYILSAGWGLVRADYRLPYYDITFSSQAEAYKKRKMAEQYNDEMKIPRDTTRPIIFFGSMGYIDLFCALTKNIKAPRHIWFNTDKSPPQKGCALHDYGKHNHKTNWHYACAQDFMMGTIDINSPI